MAARTDPVYQTVPVPREEGIGLLPVVRVHKVAARGAVEGEAKAEEQREGVPGASGGAGVIVVSVGAEVDPRVDGLARSERIPIECAVEVG